MVKFSVEKKDIENATALLNTVSGLKSLGALPSESSGLTLTPTTVTLSNMNEANGVFIENIPITIVEGSVSEHLDTTYMTNTKKLDSIVRGSGKDVLFTITEEKITVGEGRRTFDLSIYKTDVKTAPTIRPWGGKVELEKLLGNMSATDLITQNSINRSDLAGTLFSGKSMIATDKIALLYIKDGGLFESETGQGSDIIITTDIFAACAAKIKEPQATPGITEDGKRFVLTFSNITLYKTIRSEEYPKATTDRVIGSVYDCFNGKVKNILTAKIATADFMEKLREMKSIVESDEYLMSFNKEGFLTIGSANNRSGAEGQEIIDAEITFPEGSTQTNFSAKFSFIHLELLGKLFGNADKISLLSKIDNNKSTIAFVAATTEDRCYVFVPKAQV